MKILVLNQNTCNFGDDAAGVALLQQIESTFPTADISIIYSNHTGELSSATIPYYSDKVIHRNDIYFDYSRNKDLIKYLLNHFFKVKLSLSEKMNKYVSVVNNSDIILISPCGANIGIYRDWQFLLRILIAVLEMKQVFFHLNTIHKSSSYIFNLISKFVLKRSVVFVREYSSYKELIDWGLSPTQGVDTAFSLDSEISVACSYRCKFDRYIVFIPTDLSWHPDFSNTDIKINLHESILALAKYAINNNLCILVIPHLYGPMIETKFLNDVFDEFLMSGLARDHISLDMEIDTVWKYEKAISKSCVVVSMRYHGIVFAAKNFIPFISISYENKMKEVCIYTGMEQFCVAAKSVNSTELLKLINLSIDNSQEISANLFARKDHLYRSSRLVVDAIKLRSNYE